MYGVKYKNIASTRYSQIFLECHHYWQLRDHFLVRLRILQCSRYSPAAVRCHFIFPVFQFIGLHCTVLDLRATQIRDDVKLEKGIIVSKCSGNVLLGGINYTDFTKNLQDERGNNKSEGNRKIEHFY